MAVMVEVAIAANSVETALDELIVLGNRKDRRPLLELAIRASIRGLSVIAEEPFVVDPEQYIADLEQRYDFDRDRVRAELREDTQRLRLFLEAECRLLRDLGVSDRLVVRIRRDLADVATGEPEDVRDLADRFNELRGTLEGELDDLDDEEADGRRFRKLIGALQVLGGALVVGADAVVGAAASPVTGGVSIAGAAASGALGTEVVSRGARRAFGG